MEIIQDIDRPDKDASPKMLAIAQNLTNALGAASPVLSIVASDNLCSGVFVRGSFDRKEDWENGILHNSRYFFFSIMPKGKRYYTEGDKVTIEKTSGHKTQPFRKYTGTPEKAIEKMKAWFALHQ